MGILKYIIFLLFVICIKGNVGNKDNFQNLIFYNIEDTITFTEKELMKINGLKYRYLGSTINSNNIRTLQLGLIGERSVEINVDDIFTFQKINNTIFKKIQKIMSQVFN